MKFVHSDEVSWDEKIAYLVNALFGAALGFAIYLFALGGFSFLLMSRGSHWWNGWLSLFICVGIGFLAGAYSYKQRNVEIDLPQEGIYEGRGGAELLARRLGVIGMALVALYFIWQLAKGI